MQAWGTYKGFLSAAIHNQRLAYHGPILRVQKAQNRKADRGAPRFAWHSLDPAEFLD